MRGHLFIIASGATFAVGALALAATVAYAAPVPTSSSAVAHLPALVIPPNYHPSASGASPVGPSRDGLITVVPQVAVDIKDGVNGGDSATAPVPSGAVPPVSVGPESSKGKSASNNGNDLNNKGTGSNKSTSNNGKDVNNKGTGSNKDNGKSQG